MKYALGIIVVIAFTALAIFVGLWEMFIGGIVQGIDALKANPISSTDIAIAIVKVIFASFVGYVIFAIGLLMGGVIAGTSFKSRKKKRKFGLR